MPVRWDKEKVWGAEIEYTSLNTQWLVFRRDGTTSVTSLFFGGFHFCLLSSVKTQIS